MKYYSTRNTIIEKNFKDVVMQGLSSDGGLFIPKEWKKININEFKGINYTELAYEIISPYCNNLINSEDLRNLINNAYKQFHHPKIAPLVKLNEYKYVLELFYGPTFAFKDYALQFLGNLFEYFLKEEDKKITIIGATSGDTGSAAIEACKLKNNINLFILFPYQKVSEVQRRQMTTILESNINNIAVKGNFDDCQKIVKSLFVDKDLLLKSKITAVNSINWARIITQAVYYFWAALQLKENTNKIDFIVPSGNFGNVYAGYVAKNMGLSINKLHVVTNSNDILHRTIQKGEMVKKEIKETYSPSMDIQISSNFERQLFSSLNSDSNKLSLIMSKFINEGICQLDESTINNLTQHYQSYSVTDSNILETIKMYYEKYQYISDPHTATGLNILEKIENPNNCYISLGCAHPAKFSSVINKAIGKEPEFPDKLKNIFEKKEKFIILDNDTIKIKKYILDNI